MQFKGESRVIGFDDGPSNRSDRETILVGAVIRGKEYLDRVLTAKIEYDGLDVTEKIIDITRKPKHFGQLRAIFLDGISFAGFNLADIEEIFNKTKIPVIAVVRNRPDVEAFKRVSLKFKDANKRMKIIDNAGTVHGTSIGRAKIHFQCKGILPKDAANLLKKCSKRAAVPEAVRIAHLIAAGVVEGESRGRV